MSLLSRLRQATSTEELDGSAIALPLWLRARARAGAVSNVLGFTLLAAIAASRAAHGVLSPAGLVAVVMGASVAATVTGWVAGFYEGVDAGLHGRVTSVRPAAADQLARRGIWRGAISWAALAAVWSATGAVVLAAVLRDHSAPFPVLVVALLALAVPAAVAVDMSARAAGAATGVALQTQRPEPVRLLRRAWSELALPLALVQAVVNAGAAWVLFHSAAAEGTLTKGAAFADATLVAVLLASLFGVLGARWGTVDVAAGRIVVDDATPGRRTAVGPQALVYAGMLTVMATSALGVLVPSTPSLLRVAVMRAGIAGGLTLVACGLGVVRGALNATPLDLGARDEPYRVADRIPLRRRASLVAATATAIVALLASVPVVDGTPPASAGGIDDLGLVAELDAFAVRVEYDIPIPAGTGSAPQVVGAARRTGGGEAANGIAAAPTRFDPVVGGYVSNPDKEGKGDESRLPQAECAFPGALADIAFAYPTDARAETAALPPIGHATAQCGEGPVVDLHATGTAPDGVIPLGPGLSVRTVLGDALAGPVDGVLSSAASARASGVSILDGLIQVDAVAAHGESRTDGTAGGATSVAAIDLTGVTMAGTRFDLRNGDLVVNGAALPAGGSAAASFIATLTAALAPSGCSVSVLDAPSTYPQGFLFSRPQPELGVSQDGSLAASMRGGLLVQCDLPQDLTAPTGFSPERMQVALGFVYTSVAAQATIGGFGLDDIGAGTDLGGTGGGLVPPSAGAPLTGGDLVTPSLEPVAPPAAGGSSASSTPVGTVLERIELLAANFAAGRPWVWGLALALWALLTHRGLDRLRRQLQTVAV